MLLGKHFGVDSKKIEIFSSGVDQSVYKPSGNQHKYKKKLLLPEDVPIFFSLGRLDQKKGIENLLKAVSILKEKRFNFLLIIAGPVDSGWFYNPNIFRLYEKLNLQTYVHFVHRLSNSDKLDYFQAADLFVFPSIGYEAYPYVIMEAMSFGLPVVATPVGGVPDMLEKLQVNLIVKNCQPESLAEKIEYFFKLSEKERGNIGQSHLGYSQERFNGRQRVKQLLIFYNQMLK
jgi:glycosyltransferase involved in cell wall biosynthesis